MRFFAIFILLFLSSCKKNKETISSQTISLLQNKWTLISSNITFPSNTSLNSTYNAISTDYYLFASNDSLTIHQNGQLYLPSIPISLTTKYSFIDNNTIIYILNPSIQININTITNNLLVLSNPAINTTIGPGGVVTTYNGTKIDSLKR